MVVFAWIIALLGAGWVLVGIIGMIDPDSGLGSGAVGMIIGAALAWWGWRGIQRDRAAKAARRGEPSA